jgi:multidrug resistance efflux pump
MSELQDPQVLGLSILLQLGKRVRDAASVEEIGFIAVNESKQLLHYRQAALWLKGKGVFAVSGLPEADGSSPYIQWLSACCKAWQQGNSCKPVEPGELPELLAASWHEWLPPHAAVAPLKAKSGEQLGFLLLARDEQWQEFDFPLLEELAGIYAHGLASFGKGKPWLTGLSRLKGSAWWKWGVAAAAVAALFVPVRMSVQAPAEVVPRDPFVVRSPLDSVIDRFDVQPNQQVSQGQLLFEFDRTNLKTRHGVASKAFEVAAEEYRQAAQSALLDDRSRVEIEPRRGKMEEKATELSYSRALLNKSEVHAPRAGIVVFGEQSDWVGKNVSVGERVLTIADPNKVEILLKLPVADAIDLSIGSPVRLYLLTDPQHPLAGKVRYAAYKPEVSAAGVASYRIKAEFAANVPLPRIGLTGTARIYGKRVALGYYLFRRPLTALRQRVGW